MSDHPTVGALRRLSFPVACKRAEQPGSSAGLGGAQWISAELAPGLGGWLVGQRLVSDGLGSWGLPHMLSHPLLG